jgi:hypothetical protein
MEWAFTGEVIEWRGPAPYLFVAMTPEESDDLKEAARGLIYWDQVPVLSPSATPSSPLHGSQGRALPGAGQGGGAASGGDREGALVEVVCVSTSRAGDDERMDLRQPDDPIIAVEVGGQRRHRAPSGELCRVGDRSASSPMRAGSIEVAPESASGTVRSR